MIAELDASFTDKFFPVLLVFVLAIMWAYINRRNNPE